MSVWYLYIKFEKVLLSALFLLENFHRTDLSNSHMNFPPLVPVDKRLI